MLLEEKISRTETNMMILFLVVQIKSTDENKTWKEVIEKRESGWIASKKRRENNVELSHYRGKGKYYNDENNEQYV
jgi:hypothetical protein